MEQQFIRSDITRSENKSVSSYLVYERNGIKIMIELSN